MDLTLDTKEVGQAITAEGSITRYSLTGTAGYNLVRLSDGQIVASGEVENFSGYSASGTTVQTQAGETDAHERLMVILADQIVTRLYAVPGLGRPEDS
jgi:LPS-assembly lipoprotein